MLKRRSTQIDAVRMLVSILIVLGSAIASPAQTFKILLNFSGADGATPINTSLVQGLDGNLYGTTDYGGAFGAGTVFKLTPGGTLTTLYSFCQQRSCADGTNPAAGLALGVDGNFYGVTVEGGAGNQGSIFKITPNGVLATLHSFTGVDGAFPETPLVQASDGAFYGTASAGANTSACPGTNGGCGTVFKITSKGTFTLLHSFDLTDGATPQAALIQAIDGNLYGTTFQGGAGGNGTVFRITPSGALTTLHSFNGNDGVSPSGALLETAGGIFYGTTGFGGASGYGTLFKVNSGGSLTTLHNFDLADGYIPTGVLVQALDGNLYGSTESGGAGGGLGTSFKVTPAGALTTLHTFCLKSMCSDGAYPSGGLVQATNGTFYGTTIAGGTNGDGTVFTLDLGFGPFVETLPAAGKVGANIMILGTGLKGATAVTFDGTAANFVAHSNNLITATVPSGATTGNVQVTTPGGTLSSNVPFRVL